MSKGGKGFAPYSTVFKALSGSWMTSGGGHVLILLPCFDSAAGLKALP